jgi:hypothetical protein
MGKTQRSEGWQGASVGALSAKMFLVFVLARKRRLDLVTVRGGRTATIRAKRSSKGAQTTEYPLTFVENATMVWCSEGSEDEEEFSPRKGV